MRRDTFASLTTLLKRLEQENIHYSLACHRDDAIMVLVSVPGERWEVEFLADGTVEVERFVSNGEISGREAFQVLFERHADHRHDLSTVNQEEALVAP